MYADDLVITSQTAHGLQNSLDKLSEKCLKWKLSVNPCLTGGLLQPPLRFFSSSSKTLKKVTKGIYVISFTSFAVIFMKTIGGTTLPGGGVSRQSQRVSGG